MLPRPHRTPVPAVAACTLILLLLYTTPCVAARFHYIGCFHDDTDRDLDGAADRSMAAASPARCRAFCLSARGGPFRFMGLQYGGECFCGNTYGRHGDADLNCTMACATDVTQTCGNLMVSSVYSLNFTHPAPPLTTTTHVPPPLPTSAPGSTAAQPTSSASADIPGEQSIAGISVALSLVGAVAGPSSVIASAKTQLVRRVPLLCTEDPYINASLPWDLSPTGLKVGSGELRHFMGAVFGGVIILVVVLLLCFAFSRALGKQLNYGVLMIPVGLLIPGTIVSAANLIADGGALPVFVGAIGVLEVVLVPVVLIQKVLKRKSFSAKTVACSPERRGSSAVVSLLGSDMWVSREPDTDFTKKFRMCFDMFHKRCRHWVLVELATEGMLSVLAAWDDGRHCTERSLMATVIMLLNFTSLLLVRPYIAPVDNAVACGTAGLLLASSAISTSAATGYSNNILPKLLTMAAGILICCKAVLDLVIFVTDLRKGKAPEAVTPPAVPSPLAASGPQGRAALHVLPHPAVQRQLSTGGYDSISPGCTMKALYGEEGCGVRERILSLTNTESSLGSPLLGGTVLGADAWGHPLLGSQGGGCVGCSGGGGGGGGGGGVVYGEYDRPSPSPPGHEPLLLVPPRDMAQLRGDLSEGSAMTAAKHPFFLQMMQRKETQRNVWPSPRMQLLV